MPGNELQQLLQTGIQAAQSGNKAIARGIFEQILDLEPANDLAWTWLATVMETTDERRQCLEKALAINPGNSRAREALDKLQLASSATTAAVPSATSISTDRDLLIPKRASERDFDVGRSSLSFRLPGFSVREILVALVAVVAIGLITAGLLLLRVELENDNATPTPTAAENVLLQVRPTSLPIVAYATPTSPGGTPGTPRPQITPAVWTPSPTWTPSVTPPPTDLPPVLSSYTLLASIQPEGEADWSLFKLRADGTEIEPLTLSLTEDSGVQNLDLFGVFDAVWSPDGTLIVFTGQVEERAETTSRNYEELFLASADGGPITRLTILEAPHVRGAAWSPDGTQILFYTDSDGDYDLYRITREGDTFSDPLPLTSNSVIDRDPAWSPDGTQIVFVSDRAAPGALSIWQMDADSQHSVQLTPNSHNSYSPVWSPDGNILLYLSDQNTVIDCYIMNMKQEGRSAYPLLVDDVKAEERDPIWSPDGKWIMFSSNRNSLAFELFVVHPDGTALQQVTSENGTVRYAVWQP